MKGRKRLRQHIPCGGVGVAPGAAKHRRTAEHAGVEKFEQAPQLAQMVLHRRAAHRQAMIGLSKRSRFGRQVPAFLIACASSRIQ